MELKRVGRLINEKNKTKMKGTDDIALPCTEIYVELKHSHFRVETRFFTPLLHFLSRLLQSPE